MTPITRAQRVALFRVFRRDFPSWHSPGWRHDGKKLHRVPLTQWRRFRKRAFLAFGDCTLMIQWQGMTLGIEPDGYTHS